LGEEHEKAVEAFEKIGMFLWLEELESEVYH